MVTRSSFDPNIAIAFFALFSVVSKPPDSAMQRKSLPGKDVILEWADDELSDNT
jgi:hypothetical protein